MLSVEMIYISTSPSQISHSSHSFDHLPLVLKAYIVLGSLGFDLKYHRAGSTILNNVIWIQYKMVDQLCKLYDNALIVYNFIFPAKIRK